MTKKLSAADQIESMRAARVMKSVERADKRIDKVDDRIYRGEKVTDQEKDAAKRMNKRHYNKLKKKR